MHTLMLNQKLRQLQCLAHRAVRAIFADAVLCSACGALYGIVFSGFGAQARHEFTVAHIFWTAGIYAAVGFAIGAIIGLYPEISRERNLRQKLMERARRRSAAGPNRGQVPETVMPKVIHGSLTVVAANSRQGMPLLGR